MLPQGPSGRCTRAMLAGDSRCRTRGAGTPTARAWLQHPGRRNGPGGASGARAATCREALIPLRFPFLPPCYPLSRLRHTCQGLDAHIAHRRDSFRRHRRQARSSRRRRNRLSLRLPPPETLPGPAPTKTASASGGASERKRCAHTGLAYGAGRQERAQREPAAAQYNVEQVNLH